MVDVKITHQILIDTAEGKYWLMAGLVYTLPDDVAEGIINQEMGYEVKKRGKK